MDPNQPNARNWQAQAGRTEFGSNNWYLQVAGEIELPAGLPAVVTVRPDAKDSPQRFDVFELTFSGDAPAAQDDPGMEWYKVGFYEAIVGDPPGTILVTYDDRGIAQANVNIIHS